MGRIILYSATGVSLGSVLALQTKALEAGVVATECSIGKGLNEVFDQLEAGDELVVDSLLCFSSLNELLGFIALRRIRVRSLSETWFSDSSVVDLMEYQCRLYELGSLLHADRTRQGLSKAAAKGHKPGRKPGLANNEDRVNSAESDMRVNRVNALRLEQQLSVAEACRIVGISVSAYYRQR